MSHRLTYRTCRPVNSEQEAAVRGAAEAFNQGRAWVLCMLRNERDGHLLCLMEPAATTEQPGGASKWPGAYEAQCLLDGLCGISRACQVDWEIHDRFGLRPIGVIRGGVCHADAEAQAEAARNMADVRFREARN